MLVLKEIRQQLKTCYFKGDINDYILCFRELSCQIPCDKLSFFKRQFLFTDRLPPQYHQELNKIDYKGEDDLELMFQGAQECERNYRLARGQTPGKNTHTHYQKPFRKNNLYSTKPFHSSYSSHSYGKPHSITNLAAQQTSTNDAMDLDVIDLSNTECYKCHKKGHISRNCRSGQRTSFSSKKSYSQQKKTPGLMDMDLIPVIADTTLYAPMKSSQESKVNIEGSTEPDPRTELEKYKESYIEALKDLDPTLILDNQKEARIFADNSERICWKSCYLFGCYNSPKANYSSIVGKRDTRQFEEDPVPDNPNDKELFNVDLIEQNPLKKLCLESIVGFHHINMREESPVSDQPRYNDIRTIGERELMNVKTWNKILLAGKCVNQDLSTSALTDLEIAVYESLEDDPLQKDHLETFGAVIKPGDSLTLNMSDLEKMSIRSTYRPLPVY